VFVVNLAKGATGPPRPVRVIMDGEGGEPSVSIGPFVSDSDELERERDRHETRRLLYVALTRARDRLYLSSILKDGALQPGRGSLAEVLPESLKQLFPRAAAAFHELEAIAWEGQSGRSFQLRLCRPPAGPGPTSGRPTSSGADASEAFGSVHDPDRTVRCSVTEWLEPNDEPQSGSLGDGQESTAGLLVHRLLQAGVTLDGLDAMSLAARARELVRPEERATSPDLESTVAAAIVAWQRIRSRPDVDRLLNSGQCLHEVPFSLRREVGGRSIVLRGTIDCLIQRNDGSILVVEFKTGRRRAVHEQQLAVYVAAARSLFPESSVEGQIIYPAP
jgi:ATP-dependent helicase/nuclease subunit A